MAPIDKLYATYYRPAIVTIALSCTILSYLTLKFRGHSRSSEMASFDRSHTSFYPSSIVTMAVSCFVFEIKQDIGRKTPFTYPFPFHLTCSITQNRLEFHFQNFNTNCPSPQLLDSAKIFPEISALHIGRNNVKRDRQTDRQTTDRRQFAIRQT